MLVQVKILKISPIPRDLKGSFWKILFSLATLNFQITHLLKKFVKWLVAVLIFRKSQEIRLLFHLLTLWIRRLKAFERNLINLGNKMLVWLHRIIL